MLVISVSKQEVLYVWQQDCVPNLEARGIAVCQSCWIKGDEQERCFGRRCRQRVEVADRRDRAALLVSAGTLNRQLEWGDAGTWAPEFCAGLLWMIVRFNIVTPR